MADVEIEDVSFPEYEALDGLINAAVGAVLYSYARHHVYEGQAIVEIGSYHGKSTAYLARGALDGLGQRVLAIDTWSSEFSAWRASVLNTIPSPTFETFDGQLLNVGLRDQVDAYNGTSVDAAAAYAAELAAGDAEPVGLLYVDGDHSYEAITADFEAWRPLMAEGGVMIFDDYTRTNPGVMQYLRELRDSGRIVPIGTLAKRLVAAHMGVEPEPVTSDV